jgi:ABC-type cobalt transport system substrate-binding protein
MTTLFFSLQAAAGAFVIGYFFGYYRGRRLRD